MRIKAGGSEGVGGKKDPSPGKKRESLEYPLETTQALGREKVRKGKR